MNWETLLNGYVYPAIFGLLLVLLSVGLKMLAAYLKTLTTKIRNETLISVVEAAVAGIEQQASVAEKTGQEKWAGSTKKDLAIADAKVSAEAKGMAVTDIEIAKMIESVLGSQK